MSITFKPNPDSSVDVLINDLSALIVDGEGVIQITNPQPYASDSNHVLTPKHLHDLFAQHSMTTQGWHRLPSGLIIQWGRGSDGVNPTTSYFSHRVYFPIAFPTACLTLVTGSGTNANNFDVGYWGNVTTAEVGIPTTTWFDIGVRAHNNIGHGRSYQWFAIGY